MRHLLLLLLLPVSLLAESELVVPIKYLNNVTIKVGWSEEEAFASAAQRDKFFSTTDTSKELKAFEKIFPQKIELISKARTIVSVLPLYSRDTINASTCNRMSGAIIILAPQSKVQELQLDELPSIN